MRNASSRLVRAIDPRGPWLWLLITGLVSLVTVAFIASNLRRGFDWTDEAWVYSLISNSRPTPGEAWGFQHVLHPVFTALGESILAFRVLRLGAYLGLAAVTTVVLLRVARMLAWRLPRGSFVLVFLVANVGTLLAFAYPPRYFGYNELTAILSQSAVLVIVLLLAEAYAPENLRLAQRSAVVLWSLLAFLITLQATVKFTSAAVLVVFAVAAVLICEGRARALYRWIAAAVGVMLGLLVLWLVDFPFASYTENIVALVFDESARSAYDHSASELAATYTLSLADALVGALVGALVVVTVAVGMRLRRSSRPDVARAASIVGWSALVLLPFVLLTMVRSWFNPVFAFSDLGRMAAFLALAAFGTWAVAGERGEARDTSFKRARWSLVLGAAAVAVSPAIGAVGTNNPIAGQFLYAATLWAAAFGVTLALLWARLEDQGAARAVPAVIALIVVMTAAGLVQADARHPYRTAPYATQLSPLDGRFLDGLYATGEEAAWIAWLDEQGRELGAATKDGVAIEAPGAHMVFSNSDFASPWLAAFWPVSFDSVGIACEQGGTPESLTVIQVAPASYPDSAQMFTDALGEGCGLDFPGDFEQVATYEGGERYDTIIWAQKDN